MELSNDDVALIQTALADHAASLMRLYFSFERAQPEKSAQYKKDANRCMEVSRILERENYLIQKGIA